MRRVLIPAILIASLALTGAPALANEGHEEHHGGPGQGGQGHGPKGPGGPGPGPMGMPHGPMMMQGGGPMMGGCPGGDCGGWHPNRLRAAAIDFLESDVYRLAILPFNDWSEDAPTQTSQDMVWTERMLRENLGGALLDTGILVLPAENVEAAVRELKGLGIHTDPYAPETDGLFRTSLEQGLYSDTIRRVATERVDAYTIQLNLSAESSASDLSLMYLDYTPLELRMLADALDVDGFIMGSIAEYGSHKRKDPIIGGMLQTRDGELTSMVYLVDGATGEPMYGRRVEVGATNDWWSRGDHLDLMGTLADEFTGELLGGISHHVMPWQVGQWRQNWGVPRGNAGPRQRMRRQHDDNWDGTRAYGGNREGDANIMHWKEYRHTVEDMTDGWDAEDNARGRERRERGNRQ